jgi:hypothetical protein
MKWIMSLARIRKYRRLWLNGGYGNVSFRTVMICELSSDMEANLS